MKAILAIILSIFFINIANAQDDRYFDSRKIYSVAHKKIVKKHVKVVKIAKVRSYRHVRVKWGRNRVARVAGEVIGGRPQGCPHRFCGCALAIKIFGTPKRDLWLAANWLRFPRAEAAPGMVAARKGHVFQLQAHVERSIWRVWDANSGGGRIRIHNRSIAGYTIVNPGSRMASLY